MKVNLEKEEITSILLGIKQSTLNDVRLKESDKSDIENCQNALDKIDAENLEETDVVLSKKRLGSWLAEKSMQLNGYLQIREEAEPLLRVAAKIQKTDKRLDILRDSQFPGMRKRILNIVKNETAFKEKKRRVLEIELDDDGELKS